MILNILILLGKSDATAPTINMNAVDLLYIREKLSANL